MCPAHWRPLCVPKTKRSHRLIRRICPICRTGEAIGLFTTKAIAHCDFAQSALMRFPAPYPRGGGGGATPRFWTRTTPPPLLTVGRRPPGRNWSGVDPPLSLQPRLPHGLHCFLSSLLVFVAIGPLCSPFVSFSLPRWLGFGIWVPGFWALSPGHFTLVLSPGRGVHSGYHVWSTCALVVLTVAGLSWPDSRRSVCLQGHGGLTV